ncbi:MAG: hypothetical protein WD810_07770 [Solirubrobacterales bacterium]
MEAVRRRLTYANVIATLALFLALSGGVVWASGKIGAKKLKANSVSAGKIKRNAVTTAKIRAKAVTTAKIKDGAVTFAKLATGANVIARASGGPVPASGSAPVTVTLTGTTSFTPTAEAVDFLSVEAKGENLGRVGEEACAARVVPFVNGSQWDVAEGALLVVAFAPTPEFPTGLLPVTGATAPIGLTSPGVTQTISAKVFGDPDCTPASTVSVAFAVTQAK